jgi:serine O-acetyltransferase
MWNQLREDARRLRSAYPRPFPFYVLEALLFENGFQAVVYYRMANWCKRHGIPFLGPFFARLGLFFTGVDISANAEIGPGLRISHGVGTVIGGFAKLGSGALVLHGVTLGSPSEGRVEEMPVVGDRAFLGAGATLIGAITLGDDVVIGPHALVTEDVPSNSRVLSTTGIEVTPRKPPKVPPRNTEESP